MHAQGKRALILRRKSIKKCAKKVKKHKVYGWIFKTGLLETERFLESGVSALLLFFMRQEKPCRFFYANKTNECFLYKKLVRFVRFGGCRIAVNKRREAVTWA